MSNSIGAVTRRSRRVILATAAASLVGLVGGATGAIGVTTIAHTHVDRFEYGNSSCSTKPKGPVNVLFYGPGLTANETADQVARYANQRQRHFVGTASWIHNDAGACLKQTIQERRGLLIIKHHTRVFDTQTLNAANQSVIAADPHIDRKSTHRRCGITIPVATGQGTVAKFHYGDAVPAHYSGHGSGYTYGGQEVEQAFGGLGSSRVGSLYTPDNSIFVQCNGAKAGFNGYVYTIRLG